MSNASQDLQVASQIGSVSVDPYMIKKACNNLKAWHQEGKLGSLPDWDGDGLEGWMDLLGLNGRPIRAHRPAGLRS